MFSLLRNSVMKIKKKVTTDFSRTEYTQHNSIMEISTFVKDSGTSNATCVK